MSLAQAQERGADFQDDFFVKIIKDDLAIFSVQLEMLSGFVG